MAIPGTVWAPQGGGSSTPGSSVSPPGSRAGIPGSGAGDPGLARASRRAERGSSFGVARAPQGERGHLSGSWESPGSGAIPSGNRAGSPGSGAGIPGVPRASRGAQRAPWGRSAQLGEGVGTPGRVWAPRAGCGHPGVGSDKPAETPGQPPLPVSAAARSSRRAAVPQSSCSSGGAMAPVRGRLQRQLRDASLTSLPLSSSRCGPNGFAFAFEPEPPGGTRRPAGNGRRGQGGDAVPGGDSVPGGNSVPRDAMPGKG